MTKASPSPVAAMQDARRQLEEAERFRLQGRLDRAESMCHALVRKHTNYVAAYHTLGLVHLDKRNFERALDCLVRASMLDPDNWMTLTALSRVYLRLGAAEMAARTLERARHLRPQEPSIVVSLADILRSDREYEQAVPAYREALDAGVSSAGVGLALSLMAMGETAEAKDVLQRLFHAGYRTLDLLHAMCTLPGGASGIDVIGTLDEVVRSQKTTDPDFETTAMFIRGAALDASGRHAEAWDCISAANRKIAAARQTESHNQSAQENASLAKLSALNGVAAAANTGAPVSLFILGPSRSGKTSLERLVGSLDGVKRGYENPCIDVALRRAFQASALPPARHLEQLPTSCLSAFREFYREEFGRRAGAARVFTQTAPARIHDAALIAAVLPNARFVILRRNRDDTALRIYMSKYARDNVYAYDLRSIYRHIEWYDRMADSLVAKFPQITRVVEYEAMVAAPAETLAETAALCGLQVARLSPQPLPDDRGCAAPYADRLAAR